MKARPIDEYHEDMGDVLWWKFPVVEPPYCGNPNDLGYTVETEVVMRRHGQPPVTKVIREQVGGWPGYHTHFTTFDVPTE